MSQKYLSGAPRLSHSMAEAHAMLVRLRQTPDDTPVPGADTNRQASPLPWGARMLSGEGDAPKLLLRVEEAAYLLSLSRKTVYDLMRRSDLASLKIGGCRRIPLTALHAFIARLEEVA